MREREGEFQAEISHIHALQMRHGYLPFSLSISTIRLHALILSEVYGQERENEICPNFRAGERESLKKTQEGLGVESLSVCT